MENVFLVVTGNRYPEGDAGAVRQHAFAKIIEQSGYTCCVVGMGETTHFRSAVYDGITYYSLRYPNSYIVFRAMGRLLFFWNLKRVMHKIGETKIRKILLVSGSKKTFQAVERFAARHKVQLFHDSVEWYSPSEFRRGEKDAAYRHNNLVNTQYIDQKYKVFAISSYLEEHFKRKGIQTLRVPVIMDIDSTPCAKTHGKEKIRFLYAGAKGGKDRISVFIRAIEKLEPSYQEKMEFHIVGPQYAEYEKNWGAISESVLNRVIFFHGRVPRKEVFSYLSQSDFTVLLRPSDERYAKAGFPTKVVESLASATPVFCNITSDLAYYLNDNNSVVVTDSSEVGCMNCLKKVLAMDRNTLETMQQNARKTAEECFSWKAYVDKVGMFIRE